MMDDSWDKLWLQTEGRVKIMGDRFNETWLGKVKIEGDKLKKKAELWEQYAIYDNEKEADIPVKDLLIAYEELRGHKTDAQRMCTKLKKIEAWFESEKGYNTPGFEKLAEILGKEAS